MELWGGLEQCFSCCAAAPANNAGIHHLEAKRLTRVPLEVTRRRATVVELWLQDNEVTDISCLGDCGAMELLYMSKNNLARLDAAAAAGWVRLQELNVSSNPRLSELPATSKQWVDLKQLYLNELPLLRELPSGGVAKWSKLKVLHVNSSGLTELGEEVGALTSLVQVSISNCPRLAALPAAIGQWTKVEKVFLNDNALVRIPEDVGNLSCLEKLYVNGNKLEALPSTLGSLGLLEELYFANNQVQALPPTLVSCERLNKLHAPFNKIQALGKLPPSLQLLNLSQNELAEVASSSLEGLRGLMFLHVASNKLQAFPFGALDGAYGTLRICDLSGNPDLQKTYSADIEAVDARLVKPWSFDSQCGGDGGPAPGHAAPPAVECAAAAVPPPPPTGGTSASPSPAPLVA